MSRVCARTNRRPERDATVYKNDELIVKHPATPAPPLPPPWHLPAAPSKTSTRSSLAPTTPLTSHSLHSSARTHTPRTSSTSSSPGDSPASTSPTSTPSNTPSSATRTTASTIANGPQSDLPPPRLVRSSEQQVLSGTSLVALQRQVTGRASLLQLLVRSGGLGKHPRDRRVPRRAPPAVGSGRRQHQL